MATTMPVLRDEEALVRESVEQVALPRGVRLKEVRLGNDWEGDPAWRIIFLLSSRAPSSTAFSKSLNRLIDEVSDKVTDLHTGKFPYVNFESTKLP